ncbi:hypothetical protein K493DRAFT_312182 [Basidiobolus meristosporus CBS 931.73]|uniref:N-acetyltransferase domain-containing protein n=1 Tax=Basidiobolus meristosporus CBS 931.73 TaxID=1314790 RepID=A0A1Y1YX18_9FUNG|nr:hypothetical protein K493DRAFT_312182 [Basidiobolus meristosporus CBS 931.73]|eukprot:ORY02105.1 hypothetical protein K493DRAFT_312182 [Basidiobolus meristosporus CBS 931.73]
MTILKEEIVFGLLKPTTASNIVQQCKSLIIESFFNHGSLECELQKIYPKEQVYKFISEYVSNLAEASIPHEISVYAFEKHTEQVVGVFLNGNCILEQFDLEAAQDPILQFLEQLDNVYFQHRQNEGQYFHGVMVGVHPNFSRRGIFKNLCLLSFQVARRKNFKFFIAECSSPYTYSTLRKFGATVEASCKYAEFKYNGTAPFQGLQGECCLVQLSHEQLQEALNQNQPPPIDL